MDKEPLYDYSVVNLSTLLFENRTFTRHFISPVKAFTNLSIGAGNISRKCFKALPI